MSGNEGSIFLFFFEKLLRDFFLKNLRGENRIILLYIMIITSRYIAASLPLPLDRCPFKNLLRYELLFNCPVQPEGTNMSKARLCTTIFANPLGSSILILVFISRTHAAVLSIFSCMVFIVAFA